MILDDVPVIDIGELEQRSTRRRLDLACRSWGFFQVINHGISTALIRDLHRQMQRFFAQPASEKRKIERSLENPWGYYDQELTRNTRDWKEIYDYGPAVESNVAGSPSPSPQWPPELPEFRSAVLDYYAACEELAFRLLASICANLGMPDNYLGQEFEAGHSSFLRLNHYPTCPDPAHPDGASEPVHGYLGLNRHTDAGALTILLQDNQPGLEVYKNSRWHLVTPIDGALTINIGDIVQVWSNDRYEAALHRVIANPRAERFSVPFFFNPGYATNYEPLPSTVDELNPPRYKRINWGEFRTRRAEGDYADYGEEIQITHYRINDGETENGIYHHHSR